MAGQGRCRWIGGLVVLAWAAAAPVAVARQGYATGFETDPLAAGWAWGKAAWEREARHPGEARWIEEEAMFEVQKGMWRSPAVTVEPLSYYAVTVVARGDAAGYWALLSYDADGNEIPASPYSNIDAADDWAEWRSAVLIPEEAIEARLLLWPARGPLQIASTAFEPVTPAEALAIGDALYAELPPVRASPDPARWTGLDRTRAALENGRPLRIVALGDSVANDLANANPQLLLERLWPGATVTLFNKVGSGTNAGDYMEGDRLQRDCLAFEPDLVIFGGMSTRSLDDIRKLAAGVTAGGADCLILTSTLMIPEYWDRFEAQQPGRQTWLDDLRAAAQADGFAVFDSGGEWDRYVIDSGLGIEFFRRDGHHANELGKQIFARLLAAHLAP